MSEKHSDLEIEQTTLEPVPESERSGWVSVALIQAGVFVCVPSLMLGGMLASSMTFEHALLAGIIGYVLATAVTAINGLIGADLHIPTCAGARSSFGQTGSRIITSLIFAIAMIGWFAVQNSVCGSSFSSALAAMGIDFPVPVSIAVWGVIMLLTAVWGVGSLRILNRIAIPALVIVMGVGCYLAVQQYGLASLGVAEGEESMNLLEGVALTVSFMGVSMACAPDFTRYQSDHKGVWLSSFVGILPVTLILLVMGALLTQLTGENDLAAIMVTIGLPVLGAVILILSTWTTNTTNAYSAGINMVMLFGLKDDKRALVTGIAGVIGTVLAIAGLLDDVSSFFDWLGYLFLPVAGIIVSDYFIVRRGKPENWAYGKGFSVAGIISFLVGMVIAAFLPVSGANILSFVVAGVLYAVLYKLLPNKETDRLATGK